MRTMATQKKRGRPLKLNAKVLKAITKALAVGNYRVIAARSGGISYETFLGWMAKGKAQREGPFREFHDAVIAAETKAEAMLVGRIARDAATDVKSAKWILSHRWRDRWADNLSQGKLEVTGANGGPLKIEDARSRLLARLEALAERVAAKKPE